MVPKKTRIRVKYFTEKVGFDPSQNPDFYPIFELYPRFLVQSKVDGRSKANGHLWATAAFKVDGPFQLKGPLSAYFGPIFEPDSISHRTRFKVRMITLITKPFYLVWVLDIRLLLFLIWMILQKCSN